MKKRLIAAILTAVMVVSSLQLQTVSVTAQEMYQETEEASLAMEDADTETRKQEEETAVEDAETESGMEAGTGTQGETAAEGTDSDAESEKKEDEADNETEEADRGSGDESAVTEDSDAESETAQDEANAEDSEEDADAEKPKEDETEIEAAEAEMPLTTSDTDIASGQYTENGSNVAWVIDANGKLTVEGTGDFAESSRDLDNPKVPWYSNADSIISAEIKVTGMTDASFMLYGCKNLTSVDLSGFDTSNVTNMSYMFYDCGSYYPDDYSYGYYEEGRLNSLDVSGFDTSNVTDMSHMFYGCRNLTSLDVSGFNTSKVTDMSYMFYDCGCYIWYLYSSEFLTSLDLSGFDTSNVTDMSYMFYGCSYLTSLDLSGFDTSNVRNMSYMFGICGDLTSLDLSGFDTGNVTNMSGMFAMSDDMHSCYGELTNLDLSSFNTGQVRDMSHMFQHCDRLISLDVSSFNTSQVTNMSCMFRSCESLANLDVSGFDTSKVTDMSGMFGACQYGLTSLDVSSFNTSQVTSMNGMFSGCHRLASVDVSGFDTSKVTDMSHMFSGCNDLGSLDLRNFDTSEVTNMSYMFSMDASSGLGGGPGSVNLSSFNTSRVTDMSGMFSNCHRLTSVDVSGFDTSQVTDMTAMFDDCDNLTSIDLRSFDTSKVTGMSAMFSGCRSLTSIDLRNFDTSKVTNMRGMFSGCKSLTGVDVSSFNTSSVVEMGNQIGSGGMFEGCESLLSLNLSGFDTSKVTNMYNMFKDCKNLTTLDLSSFDCSSIASSIYIYDLYSYENGMYGIFENCSALTRIYTPYNLSQSATLPKSNDSENWHSCDGTELIELPQNLSYSIVIMKNESPTASTISATKTRTFYEVGDSLNIDDLTVYYHDDKGAAIKVTEGYSTNANEIDMSKSGRKTLEITYNGMTAEVEITVGAVYMVTFSGTGKDDISGGAQMVREGANYKFWLKKDYNYEQFYGYTYTVTATMGGKRVNAKYDTSIGDLDVYTISNISGNLVITIEKTVASGLRISFVNEEDKRSTYTGTAIKPEIEVTYNGKDLRSGIDYTVKYLNNIKVGFATITVTGKGDFAKGNSDTGFEIVARNIADVTICGVATDADNKETLTLASGSKLTPVLYYNNLKLTSKDYVIKDANGTEISGKKLGDSDNNTTIKIEGKDGGNFTGSREVTLNVVDKKNLMKFTVTIDKTKLNTLTYDGNQHYIHEISGAITVTAKNAAKTNMEYGKDYTIVYPSDVKCAGSKKFTVVGMGLYTGSVSKSYTIKPAKEAVLSVKYDGSIVTGDKISTPFTFASSGITFGSKLTVTDSNGNALSESKDYKVSYSGNKKVGTNAKCTIKFLGNYKGHVKQTIGFEIAKADLSNTEVIIADKAYTGKTGIYKSVPYVIEDTDGANILVKSSNYKTTYYIEDPTNNDNATQMKGKNKAGADATVWVKIEAKGKNYSGTQIVSYKVREAQDLSKARITFKDTEGNAVKKMPYTGNKITDKQIKAVVNGKLAEEDDDIEVIYVNNINKGKATVIVKGTDTENCKYVGCKTATFSIVARSFSFN